LLRQICFGIEPIAGFELKGHLVRAGGSWRARPVDCEEQSFRHELAGKLGDEAGGEAILRNSAGVHWRAAQ
jgi:hypothetical protein